MTTQTEAMKLALEALETLGLGKQTRERAITAIKQALLTATPLAAPVQEPVAWLVERQHFGFRDHGLKFGPFWKLDDAIEWCDSNHVLRELYTTPPAAPVIDKSAAIRIATELGWVPPKTWAGLTDEELDQAWRSLDYTVSWAQHRIDIARAIEAKLKEKNT